MNSEKDNTHPPEKTTAGQKLPGGEILLYQSADGLTRVECRFQSESIWLTQALIAELYQKDVRTINDHLKNIYDDGEQDRDRTVRKYRIVRLEGDRQVAREIEHYNLDVILAVGYRVRSQRGTQFRRWATERLREYLLKGFTIDDERLKNPPAPELGVPDYFDELLERIRDIRASEKRMYLRVRDIFKLAADYEPSSEETRQFFKIIQNKLHFAATGMTAAELITSRADCMLPNMGLTTWKGEEVRKTDVSTAKNYLNEKEIEELNRIVVMWLDFAEDQARRRKQVFMTDWQKKLDDFLAFNEREVLPNAGQVSMSEAQQHANFQYDQFADRRRLFLEQIGQKENIEALENAAKLLPKRVKKDQNEES